MRNRFFIYFLGLVIGGATVSAQEKKIIDREVEVVGAFDPKLDNKEKMEISPDFDLESEQQSVDLEYDFTLKPISFSMDQVDIPPAVMQLEEPDKVQSGYVRGGLGTHSLFGDFYYNILQSSKSSFGAHLGHTSGFGNVKLEDGEKSKANYSQTNVGLSGQRFFKETTLGLNLNYWRKSFRYYGFQELNADTLYAFNNGDPFEGRLLYEDNKQRFEKLDLNVRLFTSEENSNDVQYMAKAGFSRFSTMDKVYENKFMAGGYYSAELNNDAMFRINGSIGYYLTSTPDSLNPYTSFSERKYLVMNVSPEYQYRGDNYLVSAGLNTYFVFDDDSAAKVKAFPNLYGELVLVEGYLKSYLGLKGELHVNNYEKIALENNYITPGLNVKNSEEDLNLYLGFKGNFSPAVGFNVRGEYMVYDDFYFFVNRSFSPPPAPDINSKTEPDYSNRFTVLYDDVKRARITGELSVNALYRWFFNFKASYQNWETDKERYAWNQPDFSLELRGEYRYSKQLEFMASFFAVSERKATDEFHTEVFTLDPYLDVNLGANYHYSDRLTAFAKAYNLLSERYYQWNGYPSWGLQLQVGANYSF